MAWPSYARIIEETGLSRAMVAKYIKILEQEGWIKRESGNSTTNTVYFAVLPEIISDEVKEFDDRIQLKLKGSTPDKLRSTPAKQGVVREVNTNTQYNNQSNKRYTEHFSKEKRIDVFSLDGYEYCKSAIEYISLCKENSPNLYDGPLIISDWDSCEDKLREVLSEPVECEGLIYNIYRERKMGRKKSVSLPYILMTFTDTDEFSHLATNCNDWAE